MTEVEWYVATCGTYLALLSASAASIFIPWRGRWRRIGRKAPLFSVYLILSAGLISGLKSPYSQVPGIYLPLAVLTVAEGSALALIPVGVKRDWRRTWTFPRTVKCCNRAAESNPQEEQWEVFDPARHRNSRPWIVGQALHIAGVAMVTVSTFTALPLIHTVEPLWLVSVSAASLNLLGAAIANNGRKLRLEARRIHAQRIPSPGVLQPGSFVLYLRTFDSDEAQAALQSVTTSHLGDGNGIYTMLLPAGSNEEHLVDAVSPVGPMVAVGIPGESLPHAGAKRMQLPEEDWKQPVRQLLERARLVVIVLGVRPGTMWEVAEAICTIPPQRLVLIAPAHMTDSEYFQVRLGVSEELSLRVTSKEHAKRKSNPLPYGRPYTQNKSRVSGIGFIRFSEGWAAEAQYEHYFHSIPTQTYFHALTKGLSTVFGELEKYERETGRCWE